MKKIAACAMASLLGSAAIFGSATHARAAEPMAERWSVAFPDHTAIPKNSARPFASASTSRSPCNSRRANARPRFQCKVNPNIAEPEE